MKARTWLPPLIWAGVIISATSTPSEYIPGQTWVWDKAAHFGMYGVFGWLLARHGFGVAGRWGAMILAVIVASGFGAIDEWHQQFIPGRSTELADWHADSVGAMVGALGQAIFQRRRSRPSTPQ